MNRSELLEIAKPILFNTEMVKVILEDRKTVTRRIIKLPKWVKEVDKDLGKLYFATGKNGYGDNGIIGYDELDKYGLVPYKVGGILYVRETWNTNPVHEYMDKSADKYIYRATQGDFTGGWRPSIHMPKVAARLFLKVTNVKVERIQDITEEQAKAEGIKNPIVDIFLNVLPNGYRLKFADLWNGLYKNWDANPWVFVYEFERIKEVE